MRRGRRYIRGSSALAGRQYGTRLTVKRPVWLFSLDTDDFPAAPMTTGGLAAYFRGNGQTAENTDLRLVHFLSSEEARAHFQHAWPESDLPHARRALDESLQPVVGFSMYTWNAAEFLDAMHIVRASCPGVLIVAGGPHVQRPDVMLRDADMDVVVLGEGEITFQHLLDLDADGDMSRVEGLAFMRDDEVVQSPDRPRIKDMSILPSALEVIALRDEQGEPRYQTVAYETTRGCPFRCAFCEWGTGAIGSKMYQHTLARIRSDLETLVAAGIKDLWLCDSNFGALREDLEKTKLIVELKQKTGRPQTVATSWSK